MRAALRAVPILLLGTTVAGWVAVGQAVDAALRDNPGSEHYFIETYASGTRTILAAGAVLQLGIAVMLWRSAGRRGTGALAALALCCGAGALTVNPDTRISWVGEPDGQSLVADHFPGWHRPVLHVLLTLLGLCCLLATVRPRQRTSA